MEYTVICLSFLVMLMGAGIQGQGPRPGGQGGTATANHGASGTVGTAAAPCTPDSCICHGELGCFRKRIGCQELTAPLPQSPLTIGTRFLLYRRGSRTVTALTSKMPSTAIYAAGFDARQPTVIAIHGWTQSATAFDGLKNVILKKGDYNVILVDWEKGAGITGRWPLAYTQPVQNTRVVGKQVAMLISHLQAATHINLASVHIVGASIGAQAAGYAGMYLNGSVGRISGLDPSKPNFEGQPAECKLESSDAQFVDIMHTNMDVAGIAESVGHVDFYPNGGRTQPGCNTAICSHLRAKSYFRSSVWTDCQFQTTRCDSTPCGPRGCPPMGFNAFKPQDTRKGDFCLTTIDRPPYCTDLKDKKPDYPGKVNPGVPPARRPGIGNTPNIGRGNGQNTWGNHGKPLNPAVQPGWTNVGTSGNSPGIGNRGNTPGIGNRGNTPGIGNGGNTPGIGNRGNTPGIGNGGNTPGIGNRGNTPGIGNRGNTPGIGNRGNTPGFGNGNKGHAPGFGNGNNGHAPGFGNRGNTPGVGNGNRGPTGPKGQNQGNFLHHKNRMDSGGVRPQTTFCVGFTVFMAILFTCLL